MDRMVGLYVHQHWPYNHPYAARTWNLRDWQGWAEGCKKLGYNTFLVWPMLETIPDPPTSSDIAYLDRLSEIIDMLHAEFDMRVMIALCPNIRANDEAASAATFERRHYYYCDELVNPADPDAMADLMRRRKALLERIRNIDAVTIIDSDPGCYPGSTNQEFVDLLVAHRGMLDEVRPGIELIYWMHAGWRGWSRFYETGKLELGTREEQVDTLQRLAAANPEPWGLANGLDFARELGLEDRVISFNYGRIEAEPSYPMTNFGGTAAEEGGAAPGPRGVMGNAQTHCVQLPNIFAFARGSQGLPVTDRDYLAFAEELVPGCGQAILAGWQARNSSDADAVEGAAAALRALAIRRPAAGPLKGLIFHNGTRFLLDLVHMLEQQAATERFAAAAESGHGIEQAFQDFVEAARAWQNRHGYQGNWWDPRIHLALRKLNKPAINALLDVSYEVHGKFDPGITNMPDQIHATFARFETFTTRLLAAMRRVARDMNRD